MPSPLPRWTGRVRLSMLPRPSRAFPELGAGRRPRFRFRGLLGVHTSYGLPDRSTAQGGLCHEASVRPVTQPHRPSASEPDRLRLGWFLPPTGSMIVSRHTPTYRFARIMASDWPRLLSPPPLRTRMIISPRRDRGRIRDRVWFVRRGAEGGARSDCARDRAIDPGPDFADAGTHLSHSVWRRVRRNEHPVSHKAACGALSSAITSDRRKAVSHSGVWTRSAARGFVRDAGAGSTRR